MEINFQKELGKYYIVLEGGKTRSEYAFRVICENKIENILKVETSRIDGQVKYYYEVDGLTSLEKCFYRKSMSAPDVEAVLRAITSVPDALDEYLLNKDNIVLSPETIFLSSDLQKVYFCYYPDETSDFMSAIKEISTFFLKKIDHQDNEAVTLAYSSFEISSRENYSLMELQEILPKSVEKTGRPIEEVDLEEDIPFDEDKKSISYDDLLEYREDVDDIEYSGYDLYEDEEVLPTYKEEKSTNEKKKNLFKIVPTLVIVIAGVILFGLDTTSTMSLALRIGCFSMISVATLLLTYLLWMKEKGTEK